MKFLGFICGTKDGYVDRAAFFTMISTITTFVLLLLTFSQLHDFKETNSADFAHKLKGDIFSTNNIILISLLDGNLIKFRPYGTDDGWFELDTAVNNTKPPSLKVKNTPIYNLVQIDLLLQDFEDLSFYEERSQINMEYIYEQYYYYIQMIWQNVEIKKYVQMIRKQPHLSTSYTRFENLYNSMLERSHRLKCNNM